MCKFSLRFTLRTQCCVFAIAALIIWTANIVYSFPRGTFDIYHTISVAASCFGLLAAISLLLGAILEKCYLLWTWIVMTLLALLIFIAGSSLELAKDWHYIKLDQKIQRFVLIFLIPSFLLVMIYYTLFYALNLKRKKMGEIEERQPGCLRI